MKNQKKKPTTIIADKKSRGEWAEGRFFVAAAEHKISRLRSALPHSARDDKS